MSSEILVIVDPTADTQPALARAHWYARETGKTVELFICDYDQYLAGERFFDSRSLQKARADLLTRRRASLEKLAKPLRSDGLDVSVDVRWDHPLHEGLIRKIEDAAPQLVFKDTHFHSALRRSIFSNTDWHLIRDCPSPLWLVKPEGQTGITSIAVAVDPTHEGDRPATLDRKLLAEAQRLTGETGASLSVIHAFDPAPVYSVSAEALAVPISEPIGDIVRSLREQHETATRELLADAGLAEANLVLRDGDVRDALVDAATETGADLLVMGAVSRSGLRRIALGSTAERVLDFIPCDLLIVKA